MSGAIKDLALSVNNRKGLKFPFHFVKVIVRLKSAHRGVKRLEKDFEEECQYFMSFEDTEEVRCDLLGKYAENRGELCMNLGKRKHCADYYKHETAVKYGTPVICPHGDDLGACSLGEDVCFTGDMSPSGMPVNYLMCEHFSKWYYEQKFKNNKNR